MRAATRWSMRPSRSASRPSTDGRPRSHRGRRPGLSTAWSDLVGDRLGEGGARFVEARRGAVSTSARSWSSRASSDVGDRGSTVVVEAGDGGADSPVDLLGQRSERRGHCGRRPPRLPPAVSSARTLSAIGRPRGVDGGGDAARRRRPARRARPIRASPVSWSCTPAVAVCTAPATEASRRCSAAAMRASVDCSIAPRAAATDWSTWVRAGWSGRRAAGRPARRRSGRSCVLARWPMLVGHRVSRAAAQVVEAVVELAARVRRRRCSSMRASTSRMRTRLPWASVRLSRSPDSSEDRCPAGRRRRWWHRSRRSARRAGCRGPATSALVVAGAGPPARTTCRAGR